MHLKHNQKHAFQLRCDAFEQSGGTRARLDLIAPLVRLAGTFTETELGEIKFPEISSSVLEIVCRYFYYKLRYQNATTKNIPEFPVAPEMALELLMAANFLDA